MTGTQGMGVSTPWAAAVAEATCGFVWVLHMPNGAMLVIGAKSMIVAARMLSASTGLTGRMESVDGASPSLHLSCAPWTTSLLMEAPGRGAPDRGTPSTW